MILTSSSTTLSREVQINTLHLCASTPHHIATMQVQRRHRLIAISVAAVTVRQVVDIDLGRRGRIVKLPRRVASVEVVAAPIGDGGGVGGGAAAVVACVEADTDADVVILALGEGFLGGGWSG